MKDKIIKVLISASSYPKKAGDPNGIFIHELNKELSIYCNPIVIAPLYDGGPKEESFDNIKVYRHKQFIFNNIELAYKTGILVTLKSNPLYYLVVPFYLMYQLLLLRQLVRRNDINIIHAHWMIPSAFVAAAYKRLFNKNIKIVATILGDDIWSFNTGLKKRLLQSAFKYIDVVTSQSIPLQEELLTLGYKGKVFHYPIGVDIHKFSPDKSDEKIKTKFNITGSMLLFVGTLIERKGIKYLIEAMGYVLKKTPKTKLVVIGAGELQSSLMKRARELNISENVIFAGKIPNHELPSFFATADIFVLPSLSEGFPLVVMEALSSGTICIVSNLSVFENLGIVKEFLITVEQRNSERLGEVIVEILEKKEELLMSRKKARTYALNEFDLKKIALKYFSVYQSLV